MTVPLPKVGCSTTSRRLKRVALPAGVWDIADVIIVNIDHHITNAGFGDINIIDANAAATGEIILRILKELNLPFNQPIASALYTAIATDTGFFRFANTSGATLEACSYLINAFHIEPAKIAEQVHEQKSYNCQDHRYQECQFP